MHFSEYQDLARTTALYPDVGNNLSYPTLGLCGESGEVAEKVKKIYRDKGGEVTKEDEKLLAKELGDVLWYVSALCYELGLNMDDVAEGNLEKLFGRKDRDKLHGDGDER